MLPSDLYPIVSVLYFIWSFENKWGTVPLCYHVYVDVVYEFGNLEVMLEVA